MEDLFKIKLIFPYTMCPIIENIFWIFLDLEKEELVDDFFASICNNFQRSVDLLPLFSINLSIQIF